MKSTLHFNLKREFFAAIAAGTKRIEYRERKPYWRKRLEGRKYDVIKFRNGYQKDALEMLVQFRGTPKTAAAVAYRCEFLVTGDARGND